MRWLNTDQAQIPYLAEKMEVSYTENAQIIVECEDDEVIAAGLYDLYNGKSIHSHIWIAKGRHPSRVWWWAMHDYPLWQLGVTNIIATVSSANKEAIKVAEHLGYKLVSMIPDYYPDCSSQLIYVGVEENAVFWHRFKDGRLKPPTYRRDFQKVA